MQIEKEHNSISRNAILIAMLFHAVVIFISLVVEFEKYKIFPYDYVSMEIINREKQNGNSQPQIAAKKDEITSTFKNTSSISIEDIELNNIVNVDSVSERTKIPVFIDDKYNNILDSVILANASMYGLKNALKENMKEIFDSSSVIITPIEQARNNLKEQLIVLYNDRYGDISPDKYAGQNDNVGLGIRIPIDKIIDLLSDIF